MAQIYREWRVLAASIFAVAAITGSYWLARGAAAPRMAQASTESALLAQIATKDSTGDGLPDWQKSLYGIPLDAATTDYFHLGMTDGEAVAKGLIVPVAATPTAPTPSTATGKISAASFGLTAPSEGSLTDAFAKNFFALYISASQSAGGSLSDAQINTIADQALTNLSNSIAPAPDFKTAAEIQVFGTGPDAMRTYAASAEAVFVAHNLQLPKSELSYLKDYLNGDTTALSKIQNIGASYQAIATGLAAVSVPQEVATTHLALVNAMARLGEAIADFGHVDSDPLASMIALQFYPQDVLTMVSSLSGVSQTFTTAGVVIPATAPGSTFVRLSSITTGRTTTP